MDYTPIQLEEKLLNMARNLNTELVLTEADINALIKMNMDTTPRDNLLIEGAHFSVLDNMLHAELNVLWNGNVRAQLHASYAISWNEPELSLKPTELKLKDIKLPISWLEEISFPLYESADSLIGVESLSTRGNELVIILSLKLF